MGPTCGDGCKNAFHVEGREAPCDTCRPAVNPHNQDAWRIFQIVQTQVVTAGMGDVIGVDFNALNFVMELYDIDNRRECFEKVNVLFNEFHRNRREK